MLCTAFLCLSDQLMLLSYTVTLSLCLLLKLNDDDDDDDDDIKHIERSSINRVCFVTIQLI